MTENFKKERKVDIPLHPMVRYVTFIISSIYFSLQTYHVYLYFNLTINLRKSYAYPN